MVVFAKFIFQPLQRLFLTPARGRCVKDYLRILAGATVLVFAKFIFQPLQRLFSTFARGRCVRFFIYQPIRRLSSTPGKGCMFKANNKAVS